MWTNCRWDRFACACYNFHRRRCTSPSWGRYKRGSGNNYGNCCGCNCIAATATSILCSSLGNGSGGANKNKPNGKKTSGKSNNGSPGKDYTKARSNKQANEWAKRFGYENAEVLKSDYVARGSQFNMYLNKKTGEIILIGIKTGVEIATGLFK